MMIRKALAAAAAVSMAMVPMAAQAGEKAAASVVGSAAAKAGSGSERATPNAGSRSSTPVAKKKKQAAPAVIIGGLALAGITAAIIVAADNGTNG